jgi:hypothetical protein
MALTNAQPTPEHERPVVVTVGDVDPVLAEALSAAVAETLAEAPRHAWPDRLSAAEVEAGAKGIVAAGGLGPWKDLGELYRGELRADVVAAYEGIRDCR